MQELEKILEEIAADTGFLEDWFINSVDDSKPVWTEKHIEELNEDFIVIPRGSVQDYYMNDGWIPVEERPPEDDGEYCTQYQIMTKYGVTEGWYHPNENVWYVLLWRHLRENGEIDFEKGDIPTLELINPEIRTDIIIAWMPLPEPYHPEELEEDSKGVRKNE